MDDRAIEEYAAFACHLADLAGRTILPYFRVRLAVENKTADIGYDPVTLADRAAEQAIRDEIHRAYPGHGILGEEHGFASRHRRTDLDHRPNRRHPRLHYRATALGRFDRAQRRRATGDWSDASAVYR